MDQVGTVRDLLGNDGATLNHYVFDSFGNLSHQSNPSANNDLLFTGREMNSTVSTIYFRARHYFSEIGRFGQEDLLAQFTYGYAANNPLTVTDRTGLTPLIDRLIIQTQFITGALLSLATRRLLAIRVAITIKSWQAGTAATTFIYVNAFQFTACAIALSNILPTPLDITAFNDCPAALIPYFLCYFYPEYCSL